MNCQARFDREGHPHRGIPCMKEDRHGGRHWAIWYTLSRQSYEFEWTEAESEYPQPSHTEV